MLAVLQRLERELPHLLEDRASWQTVRVDYREPVVERLWQRLGEYRLHLNRILPCDGEEVHFHPHPWPAAVHIVSGGYDMGLGVGEVGKAPPVVSRMIVVEGFRYEMTDPNAWHYVRPIGGESVSIMVTGTPWRKAQHEHSKQLALPAEPRVEEILHFFLRNLKA
jgi:hypothetical protein